VYSYVLSVLYAWRKRRYEKMTLSAEVDPKLVIFESFMGRSYSDNPRAIYEYMLSDKRFNDYTFMWVFRGLKIDEGKIPPNPLLNRSRILRYKSTEYHEAYARAGVWVTNSRLPGYMLKKPDQYYIQTWHGTPLKRLGYDVVPADRDAVRSKDDIMLLNDRDALRYNAMISASPFVTKVFTSSFNLPCINPDCQLWETGYPRNDRLCTATPAEIDRLKEQYDLPKDKQIILYAPTWRDNQHLTGVGYTYENEMDFDRLKEQFGDTHVILFRPHYFIANEFDFDAYGDFVRNAADVQDINDLYLVADMLITDYSSVFFDYSLLRRSVVFYMYDLAQYAGDVRGFYMSLDTLPGPISEDMESLIHHIKNPPKADTTYDEFVRKFSPHHDGQASQRVAEKILAYNKK